MKRRKLVQAGEPAPSNLEADPVPLVSTDKERRPSGSRERSRREIWVTNLDCKAIEEEKREDVMDTLNVDVKDKVLNTDLVLEKDLNTDLVLEKDLNTDLVLEKNLNLDSALEPRSVFRLNFEAGS